jgi:hypothetical protein
MGDLLTTVDLLVTRWDKDGEYLVEAYTKRGQVWLDNYYGSDEPVFLELKTTDPTDVAFLERLVEAAMEDGLYVRMPE